MNDNESSEPTSLGEVEITDTARDTDLKSQRFLRFAFG